MSNIVLGTLSGHLISEVFGKISSTMPLEQIVKQDGVVRSVSKGQRESGFNGQREPGFNICHERQSQAGRFQTKCLTYSNFAISLTA